MWHSWQNTQLHSNCEKSSGKPNGETSYEITDQGSRIWNARTDRQIIMIYKRRRENKMQIIQNKKNFLKESNEKYWQIIWTLAKIKIKMFNIINY